MAQVKKNWTTCWHFRTLCHQVKLYLLQVFYLIVYNLYFTLTCNIRQLSCKAARCNICPNTNARKFSISLRCTVSEHEARRSLPLPRIPLTISVMMMSVGTTL